MRSACALITRRFWTQFPLRRAYRDAPDRYAVRNPYGKSGTRKLWATSFRLALHPFDLALAAAESAAPRPSAPPAAGMTDPEARWDDTSVESLGSCCSAARADWVTGTEYHC